MKLSAVRNHIVLFGKYFNADSLWSALPTDDCMDECASIHSLESGKEAHVSLVPLRFADQYGVSL